MFRTGLTDSTFRLTSALPLAEFGVATAFALALPEMPRRHGRRLGREMTCLIVRRMEGSRGEEWKDYWV